LHWVDCDSLAETGTPMVGRDCCHARCFLSRPGLA
jgi:hypothetical protein